VIVSTYFVVPGGNQIVRYRGHTDRRLSATRQRHKDKDTKTTDLTFRSWSSL